MQDLLAFTIVGIVTGSVYAVAASGLVVTYVTSGIFNIAHGAIGMFMAFTYWQIRIDWGWPAPVALIVVVFVLAPLLGALIERTLLRGIGPNNVGTALVATLGLMVLLLGLAQLVWDPGEARTLPAFFGLSGFRVGSVIVTWHEVITILAAGAVAGFLWFFLGRTRIGTAMRAVVDDRSLAALNGARPDAVSMLSWAIGSSLAAVAGILLAPALQMNALVLTLLVINAYAAAMVGRLKSLPLTFIGALALGLLESYVKGFLRPTGTLAGLSTSIPTIFLFVVLLLLPQERLRAGRLIGAATPRMPSMRASFVGLGSIVAVALIASGFAGEAVLVRFGQGLAFGIIMLSLVVLAGYGGQVSLCQMSFAGLGAVAMAKFGGDGNLWGIVLAASFGAIAGALVALPSLRLQGLYLALSTMAFAALMDTMFFPQQSVFGTLGSLKVGRLDLPGISFDGERAYFVFLAVAFGLFAAFVLWIRRGPFGRMLAAMRDSQVACATLGLNLTRTKLGVFMVSASMAAIAGALFAGLRTQAGTEEFRMLQSLPLLLLAVVGGITTVSGAFIGGMLFAALPLLQEKLPTLGGIILLSSGAAAILLGRNPNGLAKLVSDQIHRVSERLTATVDRPKEVPVAAPSAR